MEMHRSQWITFEEIMQYHPDNRNVYKEMRQQLPQLVPFVGAGLSAPFYPQWGQSLQELSNNLTKIADQELCKKLIVRGRYLEAAELLSKKRGPYNLNKDFANLFSPEKLDGCTDLLRRQSVFLLPTLFPGLVVTTNLDRVLDKVYEEWNNPFTHTFVPGERPSEFEAALQKKKVHYLYSVHGAVIGSFRDSGNEPSLDSDSVVFTRSQYRHHYHRWSQTVKTLKLLFKQKPMLFLGCSLHRDKTMQVLRQVTGRGTEHYAIINAAPEARDERLRSLGRLHIRAILYPDGKYEAVRVILEKLLEDTNYKKYEDLAAKLSSWNDANNAHRFSYKENLYPLVGRDDESAALWDFVRDPEGFRWWAIQGPGGSGKSRLAWELTQDLPDGWTAHWLKAQDYKGGFAALSHPGQNTVYVAETVQVWAEELGDWCCKLVEEEAPGSKIRLLLVERNTGDWEQRLRAHLRGSPKATKAEYHCTEFPSFITLRKMEDWELKQLMLAYAEAVIPLSQEYRQEIPSSEDCRVLLNSLRRVDPDLCRPLYLLFLTDAWLSNRSPMQWDPETLRCYVLDKERSILLHRVEKFTGQQISASLLNACLTLWRTVTLFPDSDPAFFFPNAWDVLKRTADRYEMMPNNLLDRIGLGEAGALIPMLPDILGELFLIQAEQDPKEEKDRLELLHRAWERPQEALTFFLRLLVDFRGLFDNKPCIWEELFPAPEDLPDDAAVPFARLLVEEVRLANSEEVRTAAITRLRILSRERSKETKIVLELARGLVILSSKQDLVDAVSTVRLLGDLYKSWPRKSAITLKLASAYAEGNANLTEKQTLEAATASVNRISDLYKDFRRDTQLIKPLARALANLSAKQDTDGAENSVNWLKRLYKDCENAQRNATSAKEPEVAIEYAKALKNLAYSPESKQSVFLTYCLGDKKPPNNLNQYKDAQVQKIRDIVRSQMKHQSEATRKLKKLEKYKDYAANASKSLHTLTHVWPRELQIAMERAQVLYLLIKEGLNIEALESLRSLTERWPKQPEVAIHLANGLCLFSSFLNYSKSIAMLSELETLALNYRETPEIARKLAEGFTNLSRRQDIPGAAKTLTRLEKLLCDEFPNNQGAVLYLAFAYFQFFMRQRSFRESNAGMDGMVQLLTLQARHANDRKIVDACKALKEAVDSSVYQGGDLLRHLGEFEAIMKKYDESFDCTSGLGKQNNKNVGLVADAIRYLPLK